jgi:hypothetical protein
MKIQFDCTRPECENRGERYQSQIRNMDKLYCSAKCKGLDQTRLNSGQDNPNFKHGAYVNPTCDCGNDKDPRSEKCADCAGRSFRLGRKRSHEEILSVGVKRDAYIRKYVIKHDLLEYVCECGQEPLWHGRVLVLQLDHINGDPCDNRLENLRFLCPNCHTQTPTFGSGNKAWHNQRKDTK